MHYLTCYNHLIKNKQTANIALFLFAQGVSLLGTMIVVYAIIYHITIKTNSGTMLGLLTIASMLPAVVIGPIAGGIADRFNRRFIVLFADFAVAFVTLLMAIILFFNDSNVYLIIEMVILRAVGQGFQQPAVLAIIPQIATKKQLIRVNGIMDTIQAVANFGSPAIAAALLTFFNLSSILFIDVLTAGIAILIMFFLVKVPLLKKAENKPANFFKDISLGFKYIKGNKVLVRLLITIAVLSFMVTPPADLTPLLITRNFGGNMLYLSANEMVFSVGMLIGGGLISVWGGFKNRTVTLAVAIFVIGLTCVGLGVAPNIVVFGAVFFICGIALPFYNTPVLTIAQSSTDEEYMGRVMAMSQMVQGTTMPLAAVIFGPLSDFVSLNTLFIAAGVPLLILALYSRMSKVLLNAGV